MRGCTINDSGQTPIPLLLDARTAAKLYDVRDLVAYIDQQKAGAE